MVAIGPVGLSRPASARGTLARGRGFSLAEMMITLAIVAVMVTLAVPAFQELMATQRVRKGASDLQNAMLIARSQAITQRLPMTVSPATGGWEAGWTIHPEGVTTPVIQTGSALGGVTISPDADITFRVDGRAASGTAITISSTVGSKTISRYVCLDASGRPRTSEVSCV